MKGSHHLYHHLVKKSFFPLLYSQLTHQTTNIALRNMKKNTSKVQSEHTLSLHHMNIRQFFTCLNCIPPIKIPFCQIGLRCLQSRIITALSNPTEKQFIRKLMPLIVNFFRAIVPRFDFSTNKIRS